MEPRGDRRWSIVVTWLCADATPQCFRARQLAVSPLFTLLTSLLLCLPPGSIIELLIVLAESLTSCRKEGHFAAVEGLFSQRLGEGRVCGSGCLQYPPSRRPVSMPFSMESGCRRSPRRRLSLLGTGAFTGKRASTKL
ncbi:uncharacterized protein [Physcomitrium patens]|uniref:uncharacterized protein n=1 Tax=Physcomitrium patens TaxID=3218 RepID=UPI003CCE0875